MKSFFGLMTTLAFAFPQVNEASAAVLTEDIVVDGVSWTVSVLEHDTFSNISSLLMSQEWWGNEALAKSFASAAPVSADTLGGWGANFLYDYQPFSFDPSRGTIYGAQYSSGTQKTYALYWDSRTSFRFATAERPTPVPLPAGLPLTLAGIGGLGLMARRKRKAA